MKTIDADAHVIESSLTWDHLQGDERQYLPRILRQVSGPDTHAIRGNVGRDYMLFDNQIQFWEDNVNLEETSASSREFQGIEARLKHMDELDIDVQVLYPTYFLIPFSREIAAELAMTNAYNRWLASIWDQAGDRLPWAAAPALMSMDKVRDQMKFAKDYGAVAIFLRPLECERSLSDPYFFPLYRIASELDLAITIHAGNGSFTHHDFFWGEKFAAFKLAMVGAFHALLMNDIPAKFPDVRWALIEACAQWVPYAIKDLEKRLVRYGRKLPPDPLAANNIYVTCEISDDLDYVVGYTGEDNLVVGTDYGHTDTSAQILALRRIREDGKLPATVVDKILGPNAAALYGLD